MAVFLIINTGGTIGMVETPHGLAPQAGIISDAMNDHPQLQGWREHQLQWQQWEPLLDSSDLQPEHWFTLCDAIRQAQNIDGVLIIHGTDTLSYSAAALSYLLNDACPFPVVLTGSMQPLLRQPTDALDNLQLALQALEGGRKEVMVAVGENLLPAALTSKFTTLSNSAFATPGWQQDWRLPKTHALRFDRAWRKPQVAVFTLYPGFQASQIEQAINAGCRALLLNAYGNGNAPDAADLQQALTRAQQQNIPVFLRSQCYSGLVTVGQYAASQQFSRAGAIGCGLMPLETALTKILLLLNQFDDSETIKDWFDKALSREWQSTEQNQ